MTHFETKVIEPQKRDPSWYLRWTAVAALAMFALVWVYIFVFPMGFMYSGYAVWLAKDQLLATCDTGDLAVVGDSLPSVGFIPSRLPVVADNFAMNAVTPIEAYFIVKRILACPHLPRRVVLSIDTGNFAVMPEYFWSSSLRLGILGPKDLYEILDVARGLNDRSIENGTSNDGLQGMTRNVLEVARFPPLFFANLVTGQVFRRYGLNRAMLEKARAGRGFVPVGDQELANGNRPMGGLAASLWPPLPTLDYFFDRTVALLNDRGVAIDFVIMPMSAPRFRTETNADHEHFDAYLRQFAARYSNFHIVDDISLWPDEYFFDKIHLDDRGAEIFTDRFGRCLKRTLAATDAGHDTMECDFDWALTNRDP